MGCSNLGNCYRNGTGVEHDLAKAKELFKKACAGGYTNACKSQ